MSTDLFGRPLGGYPSMSLNIHQKRQATLLYHWMSLDYLKDLKAMIDALIKGVDVNLALAKQQGRDDLIANPRWGIRDTAINWSTNVYPALEDFRQSTVRLIAWRGREEYCGTGAYQCARMIQEFSSMWMTPEEEETFKKEFDEVYRYASKIDDAVSDGGMRRLLKDRNMAMEWDQTKPSLTHISKLTVCTDIQAETGQRPPKTGVYVPQDDVYGTLQFAWTGGDDCILGNSRTFNELGLRMVSEVGRDSLWTDQERMFKFFNSVVGSQPNLEFGPYEVDMVRADPSMASSALAFVTFLDRPCRWYFVDMNDGEFDDEEPAAPASVGPLNAGGLRCEAGQPCPQSGYWFTPARANSRSRFELGQVMPSTGGDYGATIWQWDVDQCPQP